MCLEICFLICCGICKGSRKDLQRICLVRFFDVFRDMQKFTRQGIGGSANDLQRRPHHAREGTPCLAPGGLEGVGDAPCLKHILGSLVHMLAPSARGGAGNLQGGAD